MLGFKQDNYKTHYNHNTLIILNVFVVFSWFSHIVKYRKLCYSFNISYYLGGIYISMKCPYCGEKLGLNNICINVACSHFSATINSSEDFKLNEPEKNNLRSINSNTDVSISASKSFNLSNNYSNYISKDDFAAFIGGNNTNYYLKYTDKLKRNKKFLSWNWPCFFLTNYWLLYRKLYVHAVLFIFLSFASSKLFRFQAHVFIILLMHIGLGMYANSMYLRNCEREIKKLKAAISTLSTPQYMNKLHIKGGVNWVAPLILLVIYILGVMIYIAMLFIRMANQPNLNSPSYYL